MKISAQQKGYSLIELLIVLTIMTMVAVGAFFSLRTLKEDQDLKTMSSNLQNKVRSVQTNASSGVNCHGKMGSFWEVRFFEDRIETHCEYKVSDPPDPEDTPLGCTYISFSSSVNCLIDTYKVEPSNITIAFVCEGAEGCADESCRTNLPINKYVSVIFSPVFRNTLFKSVDDWPISCTIDGVPSIETASAISIDLENSKIADTDFKKTTVLIEKGGVVRVR